VTLSERLERAKRERLLAAGLLHSEAALKPEGDVDVTDGTIGTDEIRIEVKSAGLHAVPSSADDTSFADTPILSGERSQNCPNCRREGRVDMVDLVGHTVHMSCPNCGTLWRARRAAQ
jgi:predicted RNA-binding Zn-ribbon protein involved in translation (DUF1610 family)